MSDSDVQWPLVKARLVELAPDLAGWDKVTVFAGPVDTNTLEIDAETQTAMWATFGFTTHETNAQSGECVFEQNADGYQWNERGTVHGELTIQCGSTDASDRAALEVRLFAALSGLKAACRADRTLGVLSQEGTTAVSITTAPVLATNGAAMLARFAVTYLTVT